MLQAHRLLEVDLIVKYPQVFDFLQNRRVVIKQRSVERHHGSLCARQIMFRQKTSSREGWVTAHIWSPDSLRVKLSHVPNQSTAPVVAHQGDLWDRLEKWRWTNWTVITDEDVLTRMCCATTLAILSKNTIRSWKKRRKQTIGDWQQQILMVLGWFWFGL